MVKYHIIYIIGDKRQIKGISFSGKRPHINRRTLIVETSRNIQCNVNNDGALQKNQQDKWRRPSENELSVCNFHFIKCVRNEQSEFKQYLPLIMPKKFGKKS